MATHTENASSACPQPSWVAPWLSSGMLLLALAFFLVAEFTQALLHTKGTFGGVSHAHAIAQLLAAGRLRATAALGMGLCGLIAIVRGYRIAGPGEVVEYFNGRLGASICLVSLGICQLPLFFTPGPLDSGDLICHVNAMVEGRLNLRAGHWPFYTFHFSNGTTVGLQYPMWRSLWGGLFYAVSPFGFDFNIKLISAAAQMFMLIGFYRLLRVWKFSRMACVLPAAAMAGCHQMLVCFISGAFPTFISTAFCVWCFKDLMRWLTRNRTRPAVYAGYWLGLSVMAHPVTGLFTAYFVAGPALYSIVRAGWSARKTLVAQSCAAGGMSIAVALPYLVCVPAFARFNTYSAGKVTGFQDQAPDIIRNFKWITKYIDAHPVAEPSAAGGEYISVILFLFVLAGFVRFFSRRGAAQAGPMRSRYVLFALWLFCAGALLFYGRDMKALGIVPGIKLLKVYNRSFIYFACGLAMLAAAPIDALLRARRYSLFLLLGVLLFLEQCPYWLRPSYFSLPPEQRFKSADFAGYNRDTSCFVVVFPENEADLIRFGRSRFTVRASPD